jgi:hypothetical protein
MRRRDWLKSIAVLAVVPMIGVRKAVAAAETVTEALPAVTPAPPAAETVTESPRRRQNWPPEAIWININDEPGDGVMMLGGPKDGEVLKTSTLSKYFSFPIRMPNGDGFAVCEYVLMRMCMCDKRNSVRICVNVWCYTGFGYSLEATPEAKAAALKWAHKKYWHLIRDPDASADEIRAKIRSIA